MALHALRVEGAVIGQRRLVQQRLADTAQLLELSRHNAQRAAALVQRLLAFSRQQTLVPQRVDVQQLVAGMHDLISSSTGPYVDYHDQTHAGLWPIRIDAQQLENALLNLVDSHDTARILRVHDVAATVDALKVWAAMG